MLLKLISRMVRARVFGERMAAIGQSLVARLRLAMKERGIPLWLDSPMTELITDADGSVTGAVVQRDGTLQRIGARRGVILATGGFDHDLAWRKEHLPVVDQDWSFGNPAAMGDGIRAGEKVGAATELLDEAWWFPAIAWPDGRMQFMLNERMMPAQFVVNGDGQALHQRGGAVHGLRARHDRGPEVRASTHIPCWLITDIRSFHRYVVGGHLPIPKIPFAPVPTGRKIPPAWLESGRGQSRRRAWDELAAKIGVPAARTSANRRAGSTSWRARGTTTTSTAATAPTTTTTATRPCPTPTCIRWASRRTTRSGSSSATWAPRADCAPTSTPGCCAPTTPWSTGSTPSGNTSAAVMGRSYAGAGATIGPGDDVRLRRRETHRRTTADTHHLILDRGGNRMKISLFYEFPLPRPWAPDDEHQLFQHGLDEVEAADKAGFSTVWLTEHHFLEEYCHSTAPEMFLAAASQRTKNIRLGFGIMHLPPRGQPPGPHRRTRRHPRPPVQRPGRIRHR